MNHRICRWTAVCIFLACWPATATAWQESSEASVDEEAMHTELQALRDVMVEAYESRNLDGLIENLGPDIVITWQNAERNRGPDEFRAFYDRMMEGGGSIVVDIQSQFEVDGEADLYGDSFAVASGTLDDTFKLRDGQEFTLNSKWTASLSKTDGAWKVVSFHVSPSVFDNAILDVARSWLVTIAFIAGFAGFVLGALVAWFIIRSSRKSASGPASE